MTLERHESYRGRTTPEITWRVWNNAHDYYAEFKTKREAFAYVNALTKPTPNQE